MIREAGGELVTPLTPQDEGEAFPTFRDPAGNAWESFSNLSSRRLLASGSNPHLQPPVGGTG